MGYYTTHSLEIISGNNYIDYEKEIAELADYTYLWDESVKWYDHEDHMREYSKKHPDTVFKLIGEGEESGDLWHEYYLNGKMQRTKAKLVFEPFDKSKLS